MSDEDDPEIESPIAEQEPGEPDDAASERQAERKEKRLARWRREDHKFWRDALATEIGRRAVWQILQAGHFTEQRFACGPNGFPQSEATWFEAGKRAVVQDIHNSLDVIDHEGVYLMKCEKDPRYAKAKLLSKKGDG